MKRNDILSHKNFKSLECDICGHKSKSIKGLKRHLTQSHNIKLVNYLHDRGVTFYCINCNAPLLSDRFEYVSYCSNCRYINSHTKEASIKRSNTVQQYYKQLKETKEGRKKIASRSQYCIEYWLKKGYTKNEAINKIKKIQKEHSPRTIEYWLKKGYNATESKILRSLHQKENSPRTIEYWLKRGYNREEAWQLRKKYQTNVSLESYVQRYGILEGTLKYKNYCKTKSEYSEQYCLINNIVKNLKNTKPERCVEEILQDNNIFYKKQYFIKTQKTHRFIDFYIPNVNIALEVDGDYWHANPAYYSSNDIVHSGLSAKEIWQKDKNRMLEIQKVNPKIKFIRIWEDELYKQIKNKNIKFLKEIVNSEN